jgi:hypothetical protein
MRSFASLRMTFWSPAASDLWSKHDLGFIVVQRLLSAAVRPHNRHKPKALPCRYNLRSRKDWPFAELLKAAA